MSAGPSSVTALDLDRPWDLHPQVAVRPEPFGALLYHFGTRQLIFLKDRGLLHVLQALAAAPTARAACTAVDADTGNTSRYGGALASLARSSILVERTPAA
ncbi:mycofactocin biosynthesis chaperone MftB [Streptomyces sp. NPDC052701]|uniref:mycofactocin biosynthesis chaperone MftB n=1 Tax=Streptomyces sp. NPDC052701 TaxID=3155533 RepID=UPI00342A6876